MGSPTQFGAGRLNLTTQVVRRPDLIIVSPAYFPANPRIGDIITVTAQLRNQGDADAGPFAVELRDSFGSITQNFSGLTAGASINISFNRQVNAASDTIFLTADAFNQVSESNEANNTAQLVVTAQQGQLLPDLIISRIDFSPQTPRLGDPISFSVTVTNQGNAAAGPFVVELRDSRGSDRISVGGLAAGSSTSVNFQRPILISPETFTAIADAFNQVSESNESNNSSQVTIFSQTQPQLAIDVWTDRTSYRVGEEIRVQFTINADGFVYIYDVDAQGLVSILYPRTESGNAFLRAGSYNLASLLGVSRLQVTEPTGLEHVHALLISGAVNLQLDGQRSSSFTDPNTFRSVLAQRIQAINPALSWAWDVAAFQVLPSQPANQPPVACFTFSPSQPFVNEPVTFDGSCSSDPDGSITDWHWIFEGATRVEARGVRITVRFASVRTYRVTLLVTDNQGATNSTMQEIEVRGRPPSNQPPVARFTFSPQNPIVNQVVTFDGSASYDPDGQIVRYQWDFNGDRHTDAEGVGAQTSFSYAGSFQVTLTVTDNGGLSNSTTQTITVGQAPPPPLPPLPNRFGFFIIGNEANKFQIIAQGDPSWTSDHVFQIVITPAGGEFRRAPAVEVVGNASSTLARLREDYVFMSGSVRDGKIIYTNEVLLVASPQMLEFLLEMDVDGDGKRERWPSVPAFLALGDRWIQIQANSDNGVFLLRADRGSLLPFSQENLKICGQFSTGRMECKPVS